MSEDDEKDRKKRKKEEKAQRLREKQEEAIKKAHEEEMKEMMGKKKEKKTEDNTKEVSTEKSGIEVPKDMAEDGYTMSSDELGTGMFSTTFKGHYKDEDIAIRVVDREGKEESFKKLIPRFVCILRALDERNRHIIGTLDVFETSDHIFIAMRLIPNGNLHDFVSNNTDLIDEKQTKKWAQELIHGLCYLHINGIVHRDFKTERIFLDEKQTIKISGFTYSRLWINSKDKTIMKSKTNVDTGPYCAPESLSGESYDPRPVDVWSYGVVLFYIWNKTYPFDYNQMSRLLAQQKNKEWIKKMREKSNVLLKQLFEKIFVVNPTRRQTVIDLLKDKWIGCQFTAQTKVFSLLSSKDSNGSEVTKTQGKESTKSEDNEKTNKDSVLKDNEDKDKQLPKSDENKTESEDKVNESPKPNEIENKSKESPKSDENKTESEDKDNESPKPDENKTKSEDKDNESPKSDENKTKSEAKDNESPKLDENKTESEDKSKESPKPEESEDKDKESPKPEESEDKDKESPKPEESEDKDKESSKSDENKVENQVENEDNSKESLKSGENKIETDIESEDKQNISSNTIENKTKKEDKVKEMPKNDENRNIDDNEDNDDIDFIEDSDDSSDDSSDVEEIMRKYGTKEENTSPKDNIKRSNVKNIAIKKSQTKVESNDNEFVIKADILDQLIKEFESIQ